MKNKLNWSILKNIAFFCVPLIMWCIGADLKVEAHDKFAAQGGHGDVLMLGMVIGVYVFKIGAVVLLVHQIIQLCISSGGADEAGDK